MSCGHSLAEAAWSVCGIAPTDLDRLIILAVLLAFLAGVTDATNDPEVPLRSPTDSPTTGEE